MVVRQMRKQVIASGPEPEEILGSLPQKFMDALDENDLHYPGWGKDYAAACEAFHLGEEGRFTKAQRKLYEKQRVYDDYKGFTRLNELANLELAYPGNEEDKEEVEKFSLLLSSSTESDVLFANKLEGLKNKDKLFFGDRSHPNVVALDSLELSYKGWEQDYQNAIVAHCDSPESQFPAAFHLLNEKQHVSGGNRSHWRLVQLDKLRLTYPGWQTDVSEVEQWHLHHEDSPKYDEMFTEVIEGMRDQQQIFLGWDHEGDESDGAESSETILTAHGEFYKVPVKEATEMKKSYNSIAESLMEHEGKKRQILESRSACSSPTSSRCNSPVAQRSPSPTPREAYSSQSTADASQARARSFVDARQARARSFVKSRAASPTDTEERDMPPRQVKFGQCVVCCSRPKTHVFVPCGHLCACAACSDKTMRTNASCPICRKSSVATHRVFLA